MIQTISLQIILSFLFLNYFPGICLSQSTNLIPNSSFELFKKLPDDISQAQEYKATARFKPGEILNHKVFGIGFVVAENGLNKIEVLFPQGRKLLAIGLGT
jgi:hypothetical protein